MSKVIDFEKVMLTEKSESEFSRKVKVGRYTNADILEYREFKYFFIEYNATFIGYVILAETCNKSTNISNWVLLNIEVVSEYRGYGVGNKILNKIHNIFISILDIRSYIVTLNNYIMYQMIEREFRSGVVDFYCLINANYPVEEMKQEEQDLEQIFLQDPSVHADMVVSLDKEESGRVKILYFK